MIKFRKKLYLYAVQKFACACAVAVLVGIAKEGAVTEPQSKDFLRKHNISAASSVKSALQALLDKEMVCSLENLEKTAYRVYNVFLMRWLAKTIKSI